MQKLGLNPKNVGIGDRRYSRDDSKYMFIKRSIKSFMCLTQPFLNISWYYL